MKSSTHRFADQLQSKITAELLMIGERPDKAALRGELLALDSKLAMVRYEFDSSMTRGDGLAAGRASEKLYQLFDAFDKLFRPPGMLDVKLDIGF
jgi:hypothetical protein